MTLFSFSLPWFSCSSLPPYSTFCSSPYSLSSLPSSFFLAFLQTLSSTSVIAGVHRQKPVTPFMHLAGPHDGPQGAGCARICRHHVTSSGRVRLPSRAISGAADDIRCPIAFLPQKLFETGRSHREAADKELANSRLCSRLMHELKVAEMKKSLLAANHRPKGCSLQGKGRRPNVWPSLATLCVNVAGNQRFWGQRSCRWNFCQRVVVVNKLRVHFAQLRATTGHIIATITDGHRLAVWSEEELRGLDLIRWPTEKRNLNYNNR